MTALERMTAALWEADPNNPPWESLTPGRFSWNLAHDQARAALTAIREPSEAAVVVGAAAIDGVEGDCATMDGTQTGFEAMIDHILNGGE